MANLVSMTTQQAIKALHERGYSKRRIARELGIHRRTVSNYRRKERVQVPAGCPAAVVIGDPLEGAHHDMPGKIREREAIPMPGIRHNVNQRAALRYQGIAEVLSWHFILAPFC